MKNMEKRESMCFNKYSKIPTLAKLKFSSWGQVIRILYFLNLDDDMTHKDFVEVGLSRDRDRGADRVCWWGYNRLTVMKGFRV
jgi:hypothetical protein